MSIIHDIRFTSNLWWGKPAPPATWRLSSSSSVFCNLLFFTGRLIWFCFRVGAETLRSKKHEWVNWRSLYFHDPEGNQVELVCYDENLSASSRSKMAADLIDVRQRRVSSASF